MAEMNIWEKFMVNSLFYNSFYVPLWVRRFLKPCGIKGKTLEIGCGPGFTTREIKKMFKVDLTAIDYDINEVELAKGRLKGEDIKILQADARKLPFKDNAFDTVVEMNTFHHVENYEKAVAEAYRVLKKGGRFYMMDISRYFGWPILELTGHFDGKFTKKEMIRTMEKAGFGVIRDNGFFLFSIEAEKR